MPRSVRLRPLHLSLLGLVLLACSSGDNNFDPTPPGDEAIMALGERHACLARETGTVCWGTGVDGQLGIGATPADTTPVTLPGDIAFVALTAGEAHTCGIDANGQAYCWGSDRDGQLGLGSAATELCGALPCATTPRPVAGNLHFRQLAGGHRFTCGLTVEGRAYCWGLNDDGQLGSTGDTETCVDGRCSRTPLPEASGRIFTSMIAALSHVCALDGAGTTFCWGWDGPSGGGVGHHPTFSPDAASIAGPKLRRITAGGYHTCGLTGDGNAYCWGIDAIGAGPTMLESLEPVLVVGGHHFRSIKAGRGSTCALDPDGVAFCWGPNGNGEIGNEPIGSLQRWDEPVAVSGGLHFQSIAPGYGTYCGLTDDARIACWGRGNNGELGSGHEDSTSPVYVQLEN